MCENTIAESPQGDIFLRGSDEHIETLISDPNLYRHEYPTSLTVDDLAELMDADAWQKTLIKAYLAVKNSPRKQENVIPPGMVQFYQPSRRSGRSLMLQWMDEWDSFVPPKIDQTKLQDDAYLKVLREQVLERIDK